MQQDEYGKRIAAGPHPARCPAIARACFHLNWIFLICWGLYALGPDLTGLVPAAREGLLYRVFGIFFFLIHFALISTSSSRSTPGARCAASGASW
jgi:bacteriorhodopsin